MYHRFWLKSNPRIFILSEIIISNNNTVVESMVLIFNQAFNHNNYPMKFCNNYAIMEQKKKSSCIWV